MSHELWSWAFVTLFDLLLDFLESPSSSRPNIFYPEIHEVDNLSSALSFLTQEKETFLSHDKVRWSETLSVVEVNSLPF